MATSRLTHITQSTHRRDVRSAVFDPVSLMLGGVVAVEPTLGFAAGTAATVLFTVWSTLAAQRLVAGTLGGDDMEGAATTVLSPLFSRMDATMGVGQGLKLEL